MRVTEEVHRWFGGEPIPSMTYEALAKYLGVHFDPHGKIVVKQTELETWCERLATAKLKPYQKVRGLKEVVVPRLLHQLRMSDWGIAKLSGLDRVLRKWYKKYLHLPKWTHTPWIHHRAGGTLPSVLDLVTRSRYAAALKAQQSVDPVTVAVSQAPLDSARRTLERLHMDTASALAVKKCQLKQKETSLRATHNGQAKHAMLTSSCISRNYIWRGCLHGKSMINSLRILSGTLPTKLNLHRGHTAAQDLLCRRCHEAPETDMHVLQTCDLNKDLRVARHNVLVNKIGKELRKIGYEVQLERSYSIDRERLKPDITAFRGGRCYLIDVAVPYEASVNRLRDREAKKERKYGVLRWEHINAELGQFETRAVGIAVGAAGTVLTQTLSKLMKLGLSKRIVQSLSISAIAGSAKLWGVHERAGIG